MNLWMINESLSEKFFDDQLELCYFMIERKNETFMAGKDNLIAFEQTVLSKNVTAYKNDDNPDEFSEDEERFFTDSRDIMLKKITENFANIKKML
jgi:hypothetical protein